MSHLETPYNLFRNWFFFSTEICFFLLNWRSQLWNIIFLFSILFVTAVHSPLEILLHPPLKSLSEQFELYYIISIYFCIWLYQFNHIGQWFLTGVPWYTNVSCVDARVPAKYYNFLIVIPVLSFWDAITYLFKYKEAASKKRLGNTDKGNRKNLFLAEKV